MSVSGQAVYLFTVDSLPVYEEFQVILDSTLKVIGKDGIEKGSRRECVISRPFRLQKLGNSEVVITDWIISSKEDTLVKLRHPEHKVTDNWQHDHLKSDWLLKELESSPAHSFNEAEKIRQAPNSRKPLITLSVQGAVDTVVDEAKRTNINAEEEDQRVDDEYPHAESNITVTAAEELQGNTGEYVLGEEFGDEKSETECRTPNKKRSNDRFKNKIVQCRKRRRNAKAALEDAHVPKVKLKKRRTNRHPKKALDLATVKIEPGSIDHNVKYTGYGEESLTSDQDTEVKVESSMSESKPELKNSNIARRRAQIKRRVKLNELNARTNTRRKIRKKDDTMDINTDGLDPKLIYAKKSLEKQNFRNSKRIRVELEDYSDKYRIAVVESLAQKDRGKSLEEKTYQSFECTICKRFQSAVPEKIRYHIEQHINGELDCKKCGYILSYPKEISRHNTMAHSADFENKRVCELCGMTASSYRMWKAHMSKVHKVPSFKCKHCSEKFYNAAEVVVHTREAHKDVILTCDKCGQVFISRGNWSYHSVRCNGTANADSFVCDQCGKNLNNAIALKRHVRHNHEMEKTHKCHLCSYATHTIARLQKHINAHLGNKQYHCEICQFACVQKYQLTSHMRTHSGEKPFRCDQCPYAVAWNVQLKAHKKVHGLSSAVHCKNCGVVFRDAKCLSKHEQKDHGVKANSGKTSSSDSKSVSSIVPNIPVGNKVNGSNANCINSSMINVNSNMNNMTCASAGQELYSTVTRNVSNGMNEILPNINGMLNINNRNHLNQMENNQLQLTAQLPAYSFSYQ